MKKKRTARERAILRRNCFFAALVAGLILIVVLVMIAVRAIGTTPTPQTAESTVISSETVSTVSEESSGYPAVGPNGLDANFSNLFLVNGENPLPQNYDYESALVTIPAQYINGSLNQIHKDVWPYMKAMIDAAWEDGVTLYVWSPYRSYQTQNMLFQNQIKRVKTANPALSDEEAEQQAATVVARPGTSEHHTGLAADFNMADDQFEQTEMYAWLKENAEDYGFIMRYAGDKQEITGVIHESWHWRFVGINTAKEINRLGICLEEYLETVTP